MDTEIKPFKMRIHQGRNVKRLREMLGVKQENIAEKLNLTQSAISRYEQKDEIEEDILEKIAEVLNVPVDAIKNYSEEAASYYLNTFNDSSNNTGIANVQPMHCTFNPIDKIIELYERLLKEKDELLKKSMEGK